MRMKGNRVALDDRRFECRRPQLRNLQLHRFPHHLVHMTLDFSLFQNVIPAFAGMTWVVLVKTCLDSLQVGAPCRAHETNEAT